MGDSVIVQDPVSSMFIVGFSGSVWMTRGALDFSTTPEWYKILKLIVAIKLDWLVKVAVEKQL